MATRKATESARRQAQDLAYKAMESRNLEEAVRLCIEATKLDPCCVDALVMLAGAFEPAERIAHIELAVRIAEKDLGGESYFEENRGYFWGLLETRPYMRARAYLAQTLHEAGLLDEAITEYEAMLDLNPGDNQGLRYVLIGLYLETDDSDGVEQLFDEYEDDASAVFAWSLVLDRLIAGDLIGAEQSLVQARIVNPYFEGYLLGKRPMPEVLPDFYGFGDENEAVMCMDAIGGAWKRHPDATSWLRRREQPMEPSKKIKVGRNEPCPCGSGKKYKKCCLGRDEAPPPLATGSPVAGEIALNEIRQAMEDREFSSVEEMNAFIQEYNRQRSRQPIDDFEGLSSEQMHRLINFPFESPEVIEFPSVLDNPPSAPIITMLELLVNTIGEDGLKPTTKGNLPLRVVKQAALAYWGEEKYESYTAFAAIRSEDDFYELHVSRLVAELAGLIRKYKGKFTLTSKCRKLLKGGGMSAAYPVILRTYAEKFNWGYWDSYPQTGLIQSFFAYTLYLLDRYGDQWRENTFYEDAFLRAFPSVVDTVEPTTYSDSETTIRRMYSRRCLKHFAEFLGLVEIERISEEELPGQTFTLRKLPQLNDAVRFHVQA